MYRIQFYEIVNQSIFLLLRLMFGAFLFEKSLLKHASVEINKSKYKCEVEIEMQKTFSFQETRGQILSQMPWLFTTHFQLVPTGEQTFYRNS